VLQVNLKGNFMPSAFSSGTVITSAWLNKVDRHVTSSPSNLEDFGAIGDGIADDTVAIQNWLNTLTKDLPGHAPAGTYRFTATLTAPQLDYIAITGAGPQQTAFLYDGVSTTIDLFVIGNGVTNRKFWYLANFKVESVKVMTGGAGLRLRRLDNATIRDVVAGGLDGNGRLYNGYHFDGVHVVYMSGFNTKTGHDGIIVNGVDAQSNANLYLLQGCSDFCVEAGLRCAGGFGGLFVDQVEFLGNKYGIVVDNTLNATSGNREILIGSNVVCDGLQSATNKHGVWINNTIGANAHISINGFIGSSKEYGIFVENWSSSIVSIGANRIFNCLSHGVAIKDASAIVQIGAQTLIDTNAGNGINGVTAASTYTNVSFAGKAFSNSLGNFSSNVIVGAWQSYTPLASADTGVITTSSASGRYNIVGKTVHAQISAFIQINGTGAGSVRLTLPVAARNLSIAYGRANALSGKMLQGVAQANGLFVAVRAYDNTYPAASGERLEISMTYETV
jgi:Pectate lyase superfamily protein